MTIHYDSRQIQQDDIFLAMPGEAVDGRCFMQAAVDRGASKIYYESKGMEQFKLPETEIPLIAVDGLCIKQAAIAAAYYQFPSEKLNIIGVTGTNGKTSVSYFLAQCLDHAAVIGTTGYGPLSSLKKHHFTTPMAPAVQHILREFVDASIETVTMEVSSHALVQQRVAEVAFKTAVFTNLSHDHLDFHGDMASYASAKKRLFEFTSLQQAVVNVDDAIGREIYDAYRDRYPIVTYALEVEADIRAIEIETTDVGFRFVLQTPWGCAPCELPLLGRFNIMNALAVVGVLGLEGVPFEVIVARLAQLHNPPGRMQVLKTHKMPTVVIDFAHTPDALKQALLAIREHTNGQIHVVFGCGGDRDPTKRKPMGDIASQYADQVIITNDNPRHESPEAIAKMISAGVSPQQCHVELDRQRAIERAIRQAGATDWVLIAGKGHEDTQVIGDKASTFSDADAARRCLLHIR